MHPHGRRASPTSALHAQGDPRGGLRAHGIPGAYPGTCRNLTEEQRARRRTGVLPPPAPAARGGARVQRLTDHFAGESTGCRGRHGARAQRRHPRVQPGRGGTTPSRAWTRWRAGTTCCPPLPRQAYLAGPMGHASPSTRTFPRRWAPPGTGWPNGRAVTLRELQELGHTAQGRGGGWPARWGSPTRCARPRTSWITGPREAGPGS
ncbi:hypothetical protein QJS66_19145 [Kocuria rhizophila]|nr:hypothetical protein QJS66_19145 [Kocuria rhizophila]